MRPRIPTYLLAASWFWMGCSHGAAPTVERDASRAVVVSPVAAGGSVSTAASEGPRTHEPIVDASDETASDETANREDDREALFWGTMEDPPTEHLLAVRKGLEGRSYLAGNENNLDMFHGRISGLGGAYVGVGSDQSYLFLGWMRADRGWLTDYDPKVIVLHRAYQALIAARETPEAFVATFEESSIADAVGAIEAMCSDDHCDETVEVFSEHRRGVHRRLLDVRDHMSERGVPCWLTDREQYDHVRGLVRAGRVRPMVGNWLAEGAVLAIGNAAQTLAEPVHVLYLSNAEEYWKRGYSQEFRANVEALPFDDRSVVLRTIVTFEQNRDYHYNVQTAASYLEWLEDARIKRVYEIVRHPRGKVKPRPPMYSETYDDPPKRRPRKRKPPT